MAAMGAVAFGGNGTYREAVPTGETVAAEAV